jgi:hypothetical protein
VTPDDERRLLVEVADLQAQVTLLSQEVADLCLGGDPASQRTRGRVFASVDAWVDAYFLPVFQRPIGGEFRWCAQWSEHSEARERLHALWQSWEALRLDEPAGMATWLTSLLDPQLPILMGPRGPFHGCTLQRHDESMTCGLVTDPRAGC